MTRDFRLREASPVDGLSRRILCFFTLAAFLSGACASKNNTVRLARDEKLNTSYLTLRTEHYLSLDGDRILELDRGERTLTFEFKRPAGSTRPGDDTVSVALKLYDTDPLPKGKIRFEIEGRSIEFEPTDIKREPFQETVTVLDTGQRQQENPNLANSAQAQTGYITFGKPATAGGATRTWMIYRFQIKPESAVLYPAATAKRAAIYMTIGKYTAEAQATEKEMRAWKKYAGGEYDEKVEP